VTDGRHLRKREVRSPGSLPSQPGVLSPWPLGTLEEGNRLYVTPKEFLSGNVYFYNRKKDTIGMAG